jgi:hypothetical protein
VLGGFGLAGKDDSLRLQLPLIVPGAPMPYSNGMKQLMSSVSPRTLMIVIGVLGFFVGFKALSLYYDFNMWTALASP